MDVPLKATPLPGNPYSTTADKHWYSAYETCKRLEGADGWDLLADSEGYAQPVMLATSPVVAARTLGYALIYSPNNQSRNNVAYEVNCCGDDVELLAGLAHLLIFGLIRIFRDPKDPSADVKSERLLEPAVDDQFQDAPEAPGTTPQSLVEQVNARDLYRCVFTGRFDSTALRKGLIQRDGVTPISHLLLAHIISHSLTMKVEGMSQKAEHQFAWATSASAILDRFAGTDDFLPDFNLQHPFNAVMASYEARDCFNRLGVWLTPLKDARGENIPDAYLTNVADPDDRLDYLILPEVRFQASAYNGEVVPPPHAALLAIHAACAQIAHLSGVTDLLEKFDDQDHDDWLCGISRNPHDMSFDPAGFAALQRALHRLQVGAL